MDSDAAQRPMHTAGDSLSQRINKSTTSSHTKLNRLITSYLPLALPPNTTDTTIYLTGILHIAPIYIEFESLWNELIEGTWLQEDGADSHNASRGMRLTQDEERRTRKLEISRSVLLPLRVHGLRRTERLCDDLKNLMNADDEHVQEALASVRSLKSLGEFTAHIKQSVTARPHVLFVYAWVMYMAIFSGGRYLRATLQNAGEEFWTGVSSSLEDAPVRLEKKRGHRGDPNNVIPGLSFFHFPGDEDGEDIKAEFKRRYAELELLLSAEEQVEVIKEALVIFDSMGAIVQELNDLCGGPSLGEISKPPTSSAGMLKQNLRKLMRPLGRQFSSVGPATFHSAGSGKTTLRVQMTWSIAFLFMAVAVGSVAFMWHSLYTNLYVQNNDSNMVAEGQLQDL